MGNFFDKPNLCLLVKIKKIVAESVLPHLNICQYVQCNLDLVTLLVSAKTVTKLRNVTKSNDFM